MFLPIRAVGLFFCAMAAMAASSAADATPCLLLVAHKKLSKLAELLSAPHNGVQFVAASAGDQTTELHPNLVVLHKGGYDSVIATHDADAAARLALLRRLPPRVLLEPLECAMRFADRREVCRALAELAPTVAQPRFVELDGTTGDVDGVLARAGLGFPLMCKPAVACGPRGHRLSIVLRRAGLDDVLAAATAPLIAQEYVDHGGVVIKGYTVGDLLHVATRESLPDLGGGDDGMPAVVHIDSQTPLGTSLGGVGLVGRSAVAAARAPAAAAVASGGSASTAHAGAGAGADAEAPADDGARGRLRECEAAVHAVRIHMGVALLGVDMVVAPDGRLLVVDVNHFSGAPRSVPGFGEALARAVVAHRASCDSVRDSCVAPADV